MLEINDPIKKNVCVSETVSRSIEIPITNYKMENVEKDEDGFIFGDYNFDETNWEEAYYSKYLSLELMLSGIDNFMHYLLDNYHFHLKDIFVIQRIMEGCKGWETNETEVILDE